MSSPKNKMKKETTTTHGKLPQRWKTAPEIFFKVLHPQRRNSFYKKMSGVDLFQATSFSLRLICWASFVLKSDPIHPKAFLEMVCPEKS